MRGVDFDGHLALLLVEAKCSRATLILLIVSAIERFIINSCWSNASTLLLVVLQCRAKKRLLRRVDLRGTSRLSNASVSE